jgi:RNA polymerase sigma-70 factor (ECF subfamily)
MTDEQLAVKIQSGDRTALAVLVERHHSPLLGFLYRMTDGNRPLAEDLTQEAFIRILKGISAYEYPRPFKTWLYAIATNLVRDHFKSAPVRRAVTADGMEFLADEGDLEGDMLNAAAENAVAGALRSLPDHQREVVILRYYQNLSLAEIGLTLALPVGTVKSRLSLGLRRLRALLEEGGF